MNFQGTEYAVSDQVFQQFKTGYEQAQKQSEKQTGDAAVAGHARHRPAPLADRRQERGRDRRSATPRRSRSPAASTSTSCSTTSTPRWRRRAASASRAPSELPEKLTEEQKKQAADAIKNLGVEIYTGKEDTTLRRMVVKMRRPGARRRLRQRRVRLADARLLAAGPQRGPGDQGARPARSRSTSCSASSAGCGLGGARRVRRLLRAAGASGGGASGASDLQEVLGLRRSRPAATTRRSPSAPTCSHRSLMKP